MSFKRKILIKKGRASLVGKFHGKNIVSAWIIQGRKRIDHPQLKDWIQYAIETMAMYLKFYV